MNINQVTIVGRLTRDPEMKALPNGTNVVNASIATSRTWKDQAGAKQESVEYHNIVAFGKTAEIMHQYLKKGQLVGIMGRLQTRAWDDKDSGKKMYRTEIMVENMQMGPRPQGEQVQAKTPNQQYKDLGGVDLPEDEINPDDIPF